VASFAAAPQQKQGPDATLTIFQTVSEGEFCDLRHEEVSRKFTFNILHT
jgi:hypothetical protein